VSLIRAHMRTPDIPAVCCPVCTTLIVFLSSAALRSQEIRVGEPTVVARAPEHHSFSEPILVVDSR